MTVLNRARLTFEADADGDGSTETGVFEFAGNLEITPGVRTGYLVGGRGSTVNAIISDTVGDGQSQNQGFYLDLGGGAASVDVQFRGWEGSEDADGNPYQWGVSDSVPSDPSAVNATGADPMTQLEVLFHWLLVSEIDSRNSATLEYGQHHPDGIFDPMNVVLEEPNMTKAAEDGSWFDGSITFLSAADINERIDAATRNDR